ncbi:MAG: TolB family protein, partial [Pirellulaceae bacterium]
CNTGLFYLPNKRGFGFTPLIDGISKPFVMDLDGRNKRDLSGDSNAFSYGYSISPDGQRISYHADYQVYIADSQGENRIRITDQFPFQFAPRWSPDGQWLLFVAGEHYDCHPYVVRKDGTGLQKVADRGGYRGVVEVLKHPDFHS